MCADWRYVAATAARVEALRLLLEEALGTGPFLSLRCGLI